MRFKHREQLKHHLRNVILRSVVVALVIGFGAGLIAGRDSILLRFLERHTPEVTVNAPEILANVPVISTLPKNYFWLWMPGYGWWLEKQLMRRCAAIRAVPIERQFAANRVIIHLTPRVPLVTWNGAGFDQDGVLFAITPGTWKALPQASFAAASSKRELGKWLAHLSSMTSLWSTVTSLKQDAYGTVELTLKSGTVVVWGHPETEPFSRKEQMLIRILDDAHKNLGGSAMADLRFFEQGRIIVRPKGK
jgi:hypothetical protein